MPRHRYRFPPQECTIGEDAKLYASKDVQLGTVVAIDRAAGIVDIKKTGEGKALHPSSLFANEVISGAMLVWPLVRNRAGGLMGMDEFWGQTMTRNDVAYFALPEPAKWDASEDKVLRRLVESKGNLFVNGREDELKSLNLNGRFEAFTGGADPKAGFYELNSFKPLAGLRQFEQFVRGWSVAGEMIAACTRGDASGIDIR